MARQVRAAAGALGVAVRHVHEDESALQTADALFLTNSLIGIRPARLRGGAPAPRTRWWARLPRRNRRLDSSDQQSAQVTCTERRGCR